MTRPFRKLDGTPDLDHIRLQNERLERGGWHTPEELGAGLAAARERKNWQMN